MTSEAQENEASAGRRRWLKRGFFLEVAMVGWNVLEGIVAVAAGASAGELGA